MKIVPPTLALRFELDVLIGVPIDIGPTQRGHRRAIPITGGTFTFFDSSGDHITGEVLPVGADFQTLHTPELTELSATYVLRDPDGNQILVENRGIRSADSAVIASINHGHHVDPTLVYFMTTPVLSSSSERYAWVSQRLFVAKAIREPHVVRLHFFEISPAE